MGWYSQKYFQPSASLVRLAGNGIGSGVSAAGKALINLGNDKVEQAKQKAIENEKKLKLQAQAQYNRAVNPNLANKIDPDKVGYINIQPVKLPKMSKTVKLKDGRMAEVYDDGSVKITNIPLYNEPKQILQGATAIDTVTGKPIYINKKPQKPTTKGVLGGDGKTHLYQFDINSNKWSDTGLILPSSSGGSGVKAPIKAKFADLTSAQKMIAMKYGLIGSNDMVSLNALNEIVNKIKTRKPDKNFGNIEVK